MSSGGGPYVAGDRYILDVMEPPEIVEAIGPGVEGFLRRGGNPSSTPSGTLFETITGFGNGVARRGGILWVEATSASATVKSQSTVRYAFPLGHDLSNHPAAAIWPLRYRCETIVQRVTTPIVANVPLSFGMEWNGGTRRALDEAGTPAGYELVSVSTLNGGNWTVRARLVAGGGLVVVQDTGITPDNAGPQLLELRFDYLWPTPRVAFRINGVEFGALSGFANIPAGGGNVLPALGLGQGRAVASGVGQVDIRRQGRLRVEMMAGFPE